MSVTGRINMAMAESRSELAGLVRALMGRLDMADSDLLSSCVDVLAKGVRPHHQAGDMDLVRDRLCLSALALLAAGLLVVVARFSGACAVGCALDRVQPAHHAHRMRFCGVRPSWRPFVRASTRP